MRSLVCILVLTIVLAGISIQQARAGVEASPRSDGNIQCDIGGDQMHLNACAGEDFAIADRELNKVYGQVMARLSPSSRKSLLKQQRKWIRERDSVCQAAMDREGPGSLIPTLHGLCLRDVTCVRVDELKNGKVPPSATAFAWTNSDGPGAKKLGCEGPFNFNAYDEQ